MGGGFFSKPETTRSSPKERGLVVQSQEENDEAKRAYLMREAVCMRLHHFTNKHLYEGCSLLGIRCGKSWSKARFLRALYLEFQVQIPHDYGVKYMDYPIENATVLGKKQVFDSFKEGNIRSTVPETSERTSRKRVWEDDERPSKKHQEEYNGQANTKAIVVIEDVN